MRRFLLVLGVMMFALGSSVSANNPIKTPVPVLGNTKACLSSYAFKVAFTATGLASHGAAKGSAPADIETLAVNLARSMVQNGNTVACLYTTAHGDIPVISYTFPCKSAHSAGSNAYKCS